MAENPNERSGPEHTAQAASVARSAIKAGKQLAGASKGSAFGPYGLAAGLAWENRKVIGKVIAALLLLLLLPVILLMMLPMALFGGGTSNPDEVWDESVAEEILFDDYNAVMKAQTEAFDAIDSVMEVAHAGVLNRITADFDRYGTHDVMVLHDPYADSLPQDNIRILCEYSALTNFENTINLTDLTEKLSAYQDNFFFYMVVEEDKVKTELVSDGKGGYVETEISYTQVNYTVIYLGDDYITEDVFQLTDEQKELAADFADSLEVYGGDNDAETD